VRHTRRGGAARTGPQSPSRTERLGRAVAVCSVVDDRWKDELKAELSRHPTPVDSETTSGSQQREPGLEAVFIGRQRTFKLKSRRQLADDGEGVKAWKEQMKTFFAVSWRDAVCTGDGRESTLWQFIRLIVCPVFVSRSFCGEEYLSEECANHHWLMTSVGTIIFALLLTMRTETGRSPS
jgi:hypothetical protein